MPRRRTSQEMYPLIAKWEKSGKSQKAFCESVQIKLHVFKYWVQRRKKEGQVASSDFIELKIAEEATSSTKNPLLYAEIIYPTGVALRLHQRLNSGDLKIIVQELS